MKYLFYVLILATLAFADDDGCTEFGATINPHTAGNDDITLTLINNWTLTNKALGLDIFEGPGQFYVLGADNVKDWIQYYDAISGLPLTTIPLDAGNPYCFGLAWNNDSDTDTYYTDDWSNTNLFYTDDFGVSWTTVPNPAGSNGRGMDFDGTDYWITNGQGGGLYRFQPGAGQENIAIPDVPTQPSGLAVFPYGSNLGVAITCYGTYNIYFYEWNGSTMDYIGSAACPVPGITSSFGLAYADTNGHFYWSFKLGSSDYHLAEFSFEITALERSSWGAIKSSF